MGIQSKLLLCVFVLMATVSCSSSSKKMNSWFDVQKQYADTLSSAAGNDPSFKIIPVVGPIYDIGIPLRAGTTSPITTRCKVDMDEIMESDYATLPMIKESRTFGVDASMSESLKAALDGAADIGLKLKVDKLLQINYFDLKQKIASESTTTDALSNTECMDALAGKKVAFIRGVISGGMSVISKDGIDVDPTINITQIGDFSVKYNDHGDFDIKDDNVKKVRFFIVSEFQMATEWVSTGASPGPGWQPGDPAGGGDRLVPVIVFTAPSDETVNALQTQ